MPQTQISFKNRRKLVNFAHRPLIHRAILALKRLVLPGFQKIPIWDVMKFFFESLVQGIFFQRAAAMTYYIFTALIPLFMALVALLSFLGPQLQANLLEFIQVGVPEYLWPAISKIVDGLIRHQSGAVLYLSLTLGIYLTFLSINSIVTTLNISYFNVEQRSAIKQLPISFTMVVVFLTVIIISCCIFIGASLMVNYLTHFFHSTFFYEYAIAFTKWLMLFVLLYMFLAALFYFAPYNKRYFKFFSPGALFSTILLVLLLYVLNFYFSHFSSYNLIYGSIGALLLIMLWLYWSCMAILIGFDLNVSISIAQSQQKDKYEKLKIKSSAI